MFQNSLWFSFPIGPCLMQCFAYSNSQFLIGPSPSDSPSNLPFICPCSYPKVPSEVDPIESVCLPSLLLSYIKMLLLFGHPSCACPLSRH